MSEQQPGLIYSLAEAIGGTVSDDGYDWRIITPHGIVYASFLGRIRLSPRRGVIRNLGVMSDGVGNLAAAYRAATTEAAS